MRICICSSSRVKSRLVSENREIYLRTPYGVLVEASTVWMDFAYSNYIQYTSKIENKLVTLPYSAVAGTHSLAEKGSVAEVPSWRMRGKKCGGGTGEC